MEYIDLRSDTVTQPTQAMRDAMATAPVGDDVYEDDPTVLLLEVQFAQLVGKEASLFIPTGCMANQICVMYHADKHPRGSELIVPEDCHIVQYENGSAALFSSVTMRTIKTVDGILTKELTEQKLRKNRPVTEPETCLVSIENPTSIGTVMGVSNMKEVYELAQKYKVGVHLDGARLFNASAHLGVDVKEMTQYCDTLMCCLSKGLGAPMGSMVAGSKEFILRARKIRKLFGGGLRQVGIVAAAGLISLRDILPEIVNDNKIAQLLAQELSKFSEIHVIQERLQINMIFFTIPSIPFEDASLLKQFFFERKIKISTPFSEKSYYRFLTHHFIREKQVEEIIKAFQDYFDSKKVQ